MNFVTLTSDEFNAFTTKHFSHYTQSAIHYNHRVDLKGDVHLVGVKDDNGQVIAGCLLTEARTLKFFKYFYTHRGPVMDYTNQSLVAFFFKALTSYLKKQNCLYVLVDPYLIENLRNADGEIVKSYDNRAFVRTMDTLGYKHQGFPVGYDSMSQIRWLSVLDLKDKTEDQLLKEMDYQTRRNIKKTYDIGVKTKTLQLKQQQLTAELSGVEEALEESPNSKKNKTKRTQLEQQLNSNKRKIDNTIEQIEQDGAVLNLASALFIYNEHEVYYLSSGSNPKYNAYMGAYHLQWEMIKFAKAHHIDRYNFYGITGDFSESSEDYGVQQFKKGFNAHVEEYIGDFIKPIKPLLYKVQTYLNHKRR